MSNFAFSSGVKGVTEGVVGLDVVKCAVSAGCGSGVAVVARVGCSTATFGADEAAGSVTGSAGFTAWAARLLRFSFQPSDSSKALFTVVETCPVVTSKPAASTSGPWSTCSMNVVDLFVLYQAPAPRVVFSVTV